MNGIVLPSYLYKPERLDWVAQAFKSLEKTDPGEEKPKLLLILKLTDIYYYDSAKLLDSFDLTVIPDPPEVKGTEQTLAYGTKMLFEQGCDTVTWMGDDALFHPLWIKKLRQLIEDKPQAKAWSVYHSAYKDVHRTVAEEGEYVQVSSICGHGFTVSRREWDEWKVDWTHRYWDSPYGDTLDLHHIHVRPGGERWVTKVSWVEHTGTQGLHCTPAIPEHAVDFQGVN